MTLPGRARTGSPPAEKWLREIADGADIEDAVRRRGSGLVAFGTFTFDDASDGSVLVVPRAILGRDGTGNAWLTTMTPDGEEAWQPRPADRRSTRRSRRATSAGTTGRCPRRSGSRRSARPSGGSPTHADLRKVVLARDLYASANRPIDARVLLTPAGRALPGLLHLRLRRHGRAPRPNC